MPSIFRVRRVGRCDASIVWMISSFSDSDFGPEFSADFITDFTPGEDVIELSGFGFTDLASLNFVTVSKGDAIDLGAGRFIVLEGLTAADLS